MKNEEQQTQNNQNINQNNQNLSHKVYYLVIIAGRKQKNALLTMLTEAGAPLINTLYGRGTVKTGYLMNLLGIVSEENKVVITSVMTDVKTDTVMNTLVEKFGFDKPNTGIAFAVPVNGLSY